MSDVVEDEEEDGSNPLAVAAFLSRLAAMACSSSRSRRAAYTGQDAAVALALVLSASLTRALSHCKRALVSRSEGMVEKKQWCPQGGTAARVWVLQLAVATKRRG
jgi:hypothetical protein